VTLSSRELLGYGLIAGVFVVLFALLGLEPGSWAAFGLLAASVVVLVAYREWLKRRSRS
jgi:membrane protein implicated in regulation of membrane protease activity